MTETNKAVNRSSGFKWKRKEGPPEFLYKKTMTTPGDPSTLIKGTKRSAVHEPSHKFQEAKDPEDPRLAGVYLGWKKIHEAQTREELIKEKMKNK